MMLLLMMPMIRLLMMMMMRRRRKRRRSRGQRRGLLIFFVFKYCGNSSMMDGLDDYDDVDNDYNYDHDHELQWWWFSGRGSKSSVFQCELKGGWEHCTKVIFIKLSNPEFEGNCWIKVPLRRYKKDFLLCGYVDSLSAMLHGHVTETSRIPSIEQYKALSWMCPVSLSLIFLLNQFSWSFE